MIKFRDLSEKEKLQIVILSTFAINFIIYLCLIFIVDVFVNYDLFHKTVPLTNYRLLLSPFAYCIMLFFLLLSYYMLDIEAEPTFIIFSLFAKLDFYVKLFVIVITFVLLKTRININNKIYLYILLFGAFILNMYLEVVIKKIINRTNNDDLELIKNSKIIRLSDEKVEKYKATLKNGKICFFVMVCLVPFNTVLKNIVITFIFFSIYSMVILYLVKNMYFLLYEKIEAIMKLAFNYFILVLGFVLVLLLNYKILTLKIYKFSPQELISLISFFTFPLYYPIRKIYLSLKRSNNM